jgi:hypothetical protein
LHCGARLAGLSKGKIGERATPLSADIIASRSVKTPIAFIEEARRACETSPSTSHPKSITGLLI